MEEASRYGILNTNTDNSIYEFDEKPAVPKSNNASMGIYVFTWEKLRKYLEQDEEDKSSSNDFGKNVLPAMLNAGERMYAFPFEGYWKDVGTIDSLWEANMDLLDPNTQLDLSDDNWRIYTRNMGLPPHYVSSDAVVQNSLIAEGSTICGHLEFSVIFGDVTVEKGAVVEDSILMPGAVVKEGAIVQYAIVSENTVIENGAVVGSRPEDITDKTKWGVSVIGAGVTIGKNVHVGPKEMIDKDLL